MCVYTLDVPDNVRWFDRPDRVRVCPFGGGIGSCVTSFIGDVTCSSSVIDFNP